MPKPKPRSRRAGKADACTPHRADPKEKAQAISTQDPAGSPEEPLDRKIEAGWRRFLRAANLTKEFLGIDVFKARDGWQRGVMGALCAALFEALADESVEESALKHGLEFLKATHRARRARSQRGRRGTPGRAEDDDPASQSSGRGHAGLHEAVRKLYGVTPAFDGAPESILKNGRGHAEVVQRCHDKRNQRKHNG